MFVRGKTRAWTKMATGSMMSKRCAPGCKSSLTGEDFYGAYDAQNMAMEHAKELGMDTVPSLNVVFTEEKGYITADVAEKEGLAVKKLSGTKFRQMLRGGEDIPEWFAFKSVVQVLRDHQKNAQ